MTATQTFSLDFLTALNLKEINQGTSTGQNHFAASHAEVKEIYSPVDGKLIGKVKFTTEEEYNQVCRFRDNGRRFIKQYEVIVFEPWFDVYVAGISLAGGTRVPVPLTTPGLRPDLNALAAAITPRTRMIVVNSPHNPTGTVLTMNERLAIARLAIAHDLIVVSDEAYEHMWFDGYPHVPMATLPELWDRTITVGSGGKMFSFTGWKVGWASGPADLIAAVRVARQHLSFVSGGPFQYAMAAGLGLPDSYFEDFRLSLQSRSALLSAGLSDLGFGVIPSQGTYYVTTDVRPMGYADGMDFCRELPTRAGVVAIPHQAFCDHPEVGAPYVRWAFCKQEDVLAEALRRLSSAFSS
jgi:N-succinyldiaminopimelate aminotransferase